MKYPKQFLRIMAAAGAATLLLATPAQADILLEFDDLIFGAEGSVRTVAEAPVPTDLVGQRCQISVIAENQASVHPGNDLIVSTGDSQAVIVGVEEEVNGGTTETYQVVVGASIMVQLRFGEDEMSSLGFDLSFACDQSVATTVDPDLDGQLTTSGTSSTTTPPSTVATTIPTAGVSVGCADATTGDAGNPANSTDTVQTIDTTVADGAVTAGPSTGCPDTALAATPTTTTAPPVTATPSTAAPVASATADLPQSPVATAVVAAPAYAG